MNSGTKGKQPDGYPVEGSVKSSGLELPTGEATSKTAVGDRIAQIRSRQSQADFAAEMGCVTGTLGRYERGERMADTEFIITLCARRSISPMWLLYGVGPRAVTRAMSEALRGHSVSLASDMAARYLTDAVPRGAQFSPSELVMVPYYDIRVAAGHGALVEDGPPSDLWFFKRSWIDHEVRVSPSRIALTSVSGDSMVPDIYDGDVIMIDRGDVERPREGVYVFRLDGSVYVKKLQLEGTKLMVVSRNASVAEPRSLDLLIDEPSFKLLGRVLGRPTFIRF